MKFKSVFAAALCLVGFASVCGAAAAPEYRCAWVSRFEWPSSSQTSATATIDNIMKTLADNNFNAVMFQVRGQCDVHYPSPYEPWASIYGWKDPRWDPLAYALNEAHKNGLEFHAYINTHVLATASDLPTTGVYPIHPYLLHGPNATGKDCWLIYGEDGQPVAKEDSYAWMSPGNPDASAWTRKQIMYLVRKYDVDGIHFDRIRCPGPMFSHDPASEERFRGEGNPDHLNWEGFMCRQITDDLRRIYGEVAMTRPSVKISAAPFGIMYKDKTTQYQGTGTQATHQWFQDGFRWMQEGCLDFIIPQIYWKVGSAHPFEKLLADWLSHSGGERFVVAGSTVGKKVTPDDLVAEGAETRKQRAAGWCIFSFRGLNRYWADIKTKLYSTKAPVPEMKWKKSPKTGIITGYVKDTNGKPITDARIVLENDVLKNAAGTAPYNHLSAADGFYTILNVAPGSMHRLTISKDGMTTVTKSAIDVTAGKVTQVSVGLQKK